MIRQLIRGFFVDPALEKKLHALADDTHSTVRSAQKTLGKISSIKELVILAGLGLLIAGFISGLMSSKVSSNNE